MRGPTRLQQIFSLVKKIDSEIVQTSGQLHLGMGVERGPVLCYSQLGAIHSTRLVDLRQLANAVVIHGDFFEVIIVLIRSRFFPAFANLVVQIKGCRSFRFHADVDLRDDIRDLKLL